MDIQQVYECTGLTRRELARELDVSENYLWMIESGKRKMSKTITLQIDNLMTKVMDSCQQPVDNPLPQSPTQPHAPCPVCGDPNCGLPLEPYQPRDVIRTVHDNNTKLKTITEELEVVMQSMRTLAQLDAMVQQRVDNVVSQHARGIIAVYNHHITAQAALMINTLRNTIVVMREGQISDACVIRILETLIDQLKNLKGYEPPPMA